MDGPDYMMLKLADDGWFQWGREGDISIVWNDLWRNRTKGKDRQAGALTSDRPDGAKSEWSKKESIDNCRIRTCDPEGIRYQYLRRLGTSQFESYALTTRPNCPIVEERGWLLKLNVSLATVCSQTDFEQKQVALLNVNFNSELRLIATFSDL